MGKFSTRNLRGIGVAVALAALPAWAVSADEDAGLEEVVVTGSRIAVQGLESVSPLQVVTSEDIAQSGVTNIQDLLLKNPAFGTPTISRTNSNFQTSSVGVATVDLRNLGISRTLVLVDGRRFVAGIPGDSAVDLNDIPAQFIERVDILTGGASAVYGSDAVAGVVNFIYKKNFEGIAIDGQFGQTTKSDNRESQISLTMGSNVADGRGNVMTYLGYTKQGAVYSRDRARSAVDQASVGAFDTGAAEDMFTVMRPFYSSYAPQGRFWPGFADSITFDRNGNVIPWSTNGSSTLAATGFNRSAFRTIAVPLERYLLATRGNLEFAENHSVFLEGTYASTKATSVLEPYPMGAEDVFPSTFGQVPAEFLVGGVLLRNPLVPDVVFDAAEDTDGDGLRDYYFTRRLAEVGNRGSVANRDMFRLVAGIQGKLFEDWRYEVFYSHGQSKESQMSSGQINVQNFKNALMAVADVNDVDLDGNVTEAICLDADAREQNCVPINVFGYNSISPEAIRYVTAPASLATLATQKIFGANLSGSPFQLPAGDVGVAAGFEHRAEYSSSEFDVLTQLGLNAGNALPPTKGRFSVDEFYAEANVPILGDLPFVERLEARVAARYSDYTTVGRTTTWNGGLDWKLNSQLRFRAIRAVAVRAPNVNELYTPPSQDFPTGIIDPCLGVTATSQGAIDTACRADPGVAANIAANGAFALNQSDLQGITGYDSGNPGLHEEQAKSWTFGVVYTPEGMLDGLGVSLDYFKVDIESAIVETPRQFILQQCYGGDTSFCEFVTRRPTAQGAYSAGSLDLLNSAQTNSGGQVASGLDLTASYTRDIGPGRFGARLSYAHVLSAYTVPVPGADRDQDAGEIGASKDRALLNLGYNFGKFGALLTTTYIGKAVLDDQFLISYGLEPRSVGVGSLIYNDLQISYTPAEGYEIYVGGNNILDKDPPPLISGLPSDVTGAETDSGTYDAIGRRWYAGVRVRL
ncbi:MAG: TonB-dependent receptor [Gammaproteobacteria bacterium]|nr:TonB-dependent receptor [Gammaproteobacteria bacterium]